MAKIKPFTGVYYNPQKIKKIEAVIAPPYDVISSEGQELLYKKSKHNVVRLVLGKSFEEDTGEENVYTRAKEHLETWIKEEVMSRDKTSAIYIYVQEYFVNSEKKTRKGFVSLIRLEDYENKVILPHESTLSKPKEDRLNLLRTCEANLCPIFGLYSDPKEKIENYFDKIITEESPMIDIVTPEKITHRVWRIGNKGLINKIIKVIEDKNIFIADGHHRYESALNYRNERIKNNPHHTDDAPYNYVMMYLTNLDSDGITIFPTHRLIYNLKNFDKKAIEKKLLKNFEIVYFPFNKNNRIKVQKIFFQKMAENGKDNFSCGLYSGNEHFLLLTLRDPKIIEKHKDSSHSLTWQKLDVSLLQTLIMDKVLGIKKKDIQQSLYTKYTHSQDEALNKVEHNQFQMALFLNPTKLNSIKEVVGNGEKMPQKSTYFYPKLLTGLIINKF